MFRFFNYSYTIRTIRIVRSEQHYSVFIFDHFSKTEYIRYSVFDTFSKTEYIRYSVFGLNLLFGATLIHTCDLKKRSGKRELNIQLCHIPEYARGVRSPRTSRYLSTLTELNMNCLTSFNIQNIYNWIGCTLFRLFLTSIIHHIQK